MYVCADSKCMHLYTSSLFVKYSIKPKGKGITEIVIHEARAVCKTAFSIVMLTPMGFRWHKNLFNLERAGP